jgi:myo-inositol-1(or 4)-monophosphatase
MHPMLNTAVKAARRAAGIINRASANLDRIAVQDKSCNDYVTEVDRAAEAAIIEVLHEAYPKHAILAEESGATGESDFVWIVDPLDGTTNFLHGLPQFAVSIALAERGVLTQAVVYDPSRNELFTATRGCGAFLNDRRLRVSKRIRLGEALIGTGFPYREFTHIDAYLGVFRDLIQSTAGLRRPGSASLDLAYVAASRYDGFLEIGLKPWDIAAGALLVTESGGLVGDLEGENRFLDSGHIMAASPKIFAQLVRVVAPHLTPALRAELHRALPFSVPSR